MDKMIQATPAVRVWAALVPASTPWATAKLKLYTNDFVPTKDAVIADFTEATFTGYAEATIDWGTPYVDAAGDVVVVGESHDFICTGGTGAIIYGYYVEGAGGEYLGGQRFNNAPQNVTGAGSGITVQPVAAF